MLLIKIKKTKKRFRAYPTHQAVKTTGPTAINRIFLRNNFVADLFLQPYYQKNPNRKIRSYYHNILKTLRAHR